VTPTVQRSRSCRAFEFLDLTADGEELIQQLNLDSKKVKAALEASVNWSSELDSRRQ
jgi:hypothetical protein